MSKRISYVLDGEKVKTLKELAEKMNLTRISKEEALNMGDFIKEENTVYITISDEVDENFAEDIEVSEDLTEMEEKMMKEMTSDDYYQDDLDSEIWVDSFLDHFSEGSKKGRGVLSSLIQKGYIQVSEPHEGREGNPTSMSYTEKGKEWMKEAGLDTQDTEEVTEGSKDTTEEEFESLEELKEAISLMPTNDLVEMAKGLGVDTHEDISHSGVRRMKVANSIREYYFPTPKAKSTPKTTSKWNQYDTDKLIELCDSKGLNYRKSDHEGIQRMWLIKALKDSENK